MPTNDTNGDPVVNSSLSVPLLVSTLILMVTLVWALYDELYSMRPWKAYQQQFAAAYRAFLEKTVKPGQTELETNVKKSSEYQQLEQAYEQAQAAAQQEFQALSQQMTQGVLPRIDVVRTNFQVLKSEADALIYQNLDALKDAVRRVNPRLTSFETSCFDGHYVTGDVTSDYLRAIETRRDEARDAGDEGEGAQLDLNLVAAR